MHGLDQPWWRFLSKKGQDLSSLLGLHLYRNLFSSLLRFWSVSCHHKNDKKIFEGLGCIWNQNCFRKTLFLVGNFHYFIHVRSKKSVSRSRLKMCAKLSLGRTGLFNLFQFPYPFWIHKALHSVTITHKNKVWQFSWLIGNTVETGNNNIVRQQQHFSYIESPNKTPASANNGNRLF